MYILGYSEDLYESMGPWTSGVLRRETYICSKTNPSLLLQPKQGELTYSGTVGFEKCSPGEYQSILLEARTK
jgi:hypothetical protein